MTMMVTNGDKFLGMILGLFNVSMCHIIIMTMMVTLGDKFLGIILGVDQISSEMLIQCFHVPYHHHHRRRHIHHHHHHHHDNDGDEW